MRNLLLLALALLVLAGCVPGTKTPNPEPTPASPEQAELTLEAQGDYAAIYFYSKLGPVEIVAVSLYAGGDEISVNLTSCRTLSGSHVICVVEDAERLNMAARPQEICVTVRFYNDPNQQYYLSQCLVDG